MPVTSMVLILASIACGVTGQVTLKAAMTQVGVIGGDVLADPLAIVLRVFTHPLVIAGLGCYALGAVFWLAVLSGVCH